MMNRGYYFRNYKENDFEFLARLKESCFRKYVENLYGWDDLVQEKYLREFIEKYQKNIQIIQQGKIAIGIFVYYLNQNKECQIDLLAILKKYQNKGIGMNILRTRVRKNQENGIPTILKIYKDNPAIRLCEKIGFKIYEETDHCYWMRYMGETF